MLSLIPLIGGQDIFGPRPSPFFVLGTLLFFGFIDGLFVLGELRRKAIWVKIEGYHITKRGFIGLGLDTTFYFDDFEGYKTCVITINHHGGEVKYEYLFLMRNNEKMIILSQQYHRNYSDLKDVIINKNVKYLGEEYWSLFQEIKDSFTLKG